MTVRLKLGAQNEHNWIIGFCPKTTQFDFTAMVILVITETEFRHEKNQPLFGHFVSSGLVCLLDPLKWPSVPSRPLNWPSVPS